jgi:hypothetical protein
MDKMFKITGITSVKGEPIFDVDGNNVGYELEDGTIVKLAMCLEVFFKDDNGHPTYVTKSSEMSNLGFDLTEYCKAQFIDE